MDNVIMPMAIVTEVMLHPTFC